MALYGAQHLLSRLSEHYILDIEADNVNKLLLSSYSTVIRRNIVPVAAVNPV